MKFNLIIKAIKEIMLNVWDARSSIVTLVTVSCPTNEMPSLFHCLDEHGLFTQFKSI